MQADGKIVNGVFVPHKKEYYKTGIDKYEGQEVTQEIKKKIKRRSLSQNAFYWKSLEGISDYAGYTKEELHELVLMSTYGVKEIRYTG